jgi:hypothetical protein
MSDSTPRRRPLWRRLLRFMAWSVGSLLTLCLLCYAILVAINWTDETLTPETQAWLTEPANPVPDAQNAWLAMLALAYPQQAGPQAGRRILARLRTAPLFAADQSAYERLDAQLEHEFGPPGAAFSPSPNREICSITGKGPGILGRTLQDSARTTALVNANRALLEKYYAAVGLPAYAEEGPPVYDIPVQQTSNVIALDAACLARMDISLRLKSGDRSTNQALINHLRYWQTALTHSQSLIAIMIANAQVRSDIDWISDLSRQYPQQTQAALATVTSGYATLARMPLEALWDSAIRGEFRHTQAMSEEIRRPSATGEAIADRLTRFAMRSFYLPHASANQRQRCLAHLLSEKPTPLSNGTHSSILYNPLGKSFAGCADYSEYFSRVQVTQIAAGKFVASLQSSP